MHTILEMLARNAVAATFLAAAVLLATLVIRRPAIRNALWLIVLIRFVMPPIWSVPVFQRSDTLVENVDSKQTELASSTDPAPENANIESTAFAELAPQPRLAVTEFVDDHHFAPVPPVAIPEQLSIMPLVVESQCSAEHVAAAASSEPHWTLAAMPVLFTIWLTGMFTVITLAIVRIGRFQRALRQASAAPQVTQERAGVIARRLGLSRAPTVLLVLGRVPPLLWMPSLSLGRAKLVLPIDLSAKLDARQLDAILAHEMAHLRRGDPWIRWLELATVACYWWHPLLPMIRRRLRASEEECCDVAVVSCLDERKAYATALVETLEFLDGPASPATPALASGVGPVHDLQRRITMIMNGSTRNRLSRFGALAILGVAVGALAFGPAFSNAQPEEKKGRPIPSKGGEKGEKDRPFPPKGDFKEGKEKDRPFPPNSFDRERLGGGEELERARHDLERARDEAQKAMERVRDAEKRLEKLAREREPGGPPIGFQPNRGNDRQLQEMQKQIEEMKHTLDELRRELRRDGGNRPFEPKGPPMFERKDTRRPTDPLEPKKSFERKPIDKDD